MFLQEDHRFNNAINERLERLFYIDGRDKPEHPITAVTQDLRRNTFPSTGNKTYQLEDGSIRIEIGQFWKVVSSWHLVDSRKPAGAFLP